MRIDLDTDGIRPQALPRFQGAVAHVRRLLLLSVALLAMAVLGLVLAFLIGLFAPASVWPVVLIDTAAAACVVLAGVQSARRIGLWRTAVMAGEAADPGAHRPAAETRSAPLDPVAETPAPAADMGWYERLLERLGRTARDALIQIGPATLWLGGWALLALLGVYAVWDLQLPASEGSAGSNLGAGVLLLVAFGLLVFERHLSQQASEQWPEAGALAQLLRVLLATLVLGAVAVFMRSADALWPMRLAVLTGLLPGLVAVELLIRAIGALFSPQQTRVEPRLIAQSLAADLLRWPPRPLQALQHELRNRFGIDLRQVWALGYMRRAFWPVLGVIAVVGWALTGVREVPVAGRGIYERFGEPVTVFGPGLHLGLPWPFGQVIEAENGQVHELATSLEASAGGSSTANSGSGSGSSSGSSSSAGAGAGAGAGAAGTAKAGTRVGNADTGATAHANSSADGPAPDSANRLWDATHVNDKSQVIASGQGGRQGFEIVNLDVRFVYRIGPSDQQVLAAAYHTADIPSLIRSTASRVLVHTFASRTLDELLGEQRNDLSAEIGAAVQHDLQQLDSGVEILATVVEAIHPPAGAANAYHGVQAAQIAAQALIARERGAASQQRNEAQLQASTVQDTANAGAREVHAQAQAADRRFAAEQQAFASAGQAFLLEQYLSQLSLGLINARLLIVDHRVGGGQAPTLDLRTFTLPVDPSSPSKAAP